jgi:hypothetical protein
MNNSLQSTTKARAGVRTLRRLICSSTLLSTGVAMMACTPMTRDTASGATCWCPT